MMLMLVVIRLTILGPFPLVLLMVVMITLVIMRTIIVITMVILMIRKAMLVTTMIIMMMMVMALLVKTVMSVLMAMDIAMVALMLMLLININKYRKIKHTFIIEHPPPLPFSIALLIKVAYYSFYTTFKRAVI